MQQKHDSKPRLSTALLSLVLLLLIGAGASGIASASDNGYVMNNTTQSDGDLEVNSTIQPAIARVAFNRTWSDWANDNTAANSADISATLQNNTTYPDLVLTDTRTGASTLTVTYAGAYEELTRTTLTKPLATADSATSTSSGGELTEIISVSDPTANLTVSMGPWPTNVGWGIVYGDDTQFIGVNLTPGNAVKVYVNGTEVQAGETVITDPGYISLVRETVADRNSVSNITLGPIRLLNTTDLTEFDSRTRVEVVSNTSILVTVGTNATIAGTNEVQVVQDIWFGQRNETASMRYGTITSGEVRWCMPAFICGANQTLADGDGLITEYIVSDDWLQGQYPFGGYDEVNLAVSLDQTGSLCLASYFRAYVFNAASYTGSVAETTFNDALDHSFTFSRPAGTANKTQVGTASSTSCYTDDHDVIIRLGGLETLSKTSVRTHGDWIDWESSTYKFYVAIYNDRFDTDGSNPVVHLPNTYTNALRVFGVETTGHDPDASIDIYGQTNSNPPGSPQIAFPAFTNGIPTWYHNTTAGLEIVGRGHTARCTGSHLTQTPSVLKIEAWKKAADGTYKPWRETTPMHVLGRGHWSTEWSAAYYAFVALQPTPSTTNYITEGKVVMTPGDYRVRCTAYFAGHADTNETIEFSLGTTTSGGIVEEGQSGLSFALTLLALAVIGLLLGLVLWWAFGVGAFIAALIFTGGAILALTANYLVSPYVGDAALAVMFFALVGLALTLPGKWKFWAGAGVGIALLAATLPAAFGLVSLVVAHVLAFQFLAAIGLILVVGFLMAVSKADQLLA